MNKFSDVDQKEIALIVDRLVDVYRPLQIYLFGSYAWGTPTDESDFDLCVIVESSDEKKWNRAVKGHRAMLDTIHHRSRGIDLVVYTAREFDRAASHPSTLASPIKKKGLLLYGLNREELNREEDCYMIDYHKAWILKAESDLRTAEVLLHQDNPITDTAIYHTQQCAEKALKGFLAFKRSEIEKTHNLSDLVVQCVAFDSDFNTLLEDAGDLTPKATEFRYPDDFDEIDDMSQLFPDVEEVEAAIVKAKHILDFVKTKILPND